MRDGYRAALRVLAEGDREGARKAATELQTKVLMGEKPATSDDLLEVELDAAADLARQDPEILVCRTCGYRYPVRDGIPVMLIDEAEKPATGRTARKPAAKKKSR